MAPGAVSFFSHPDYRRGVLHALLGAGALFLVAIWLA